METGLEKQVVFAPNLFVTVFDAIDNKANSPVPVVHHEDVR